VPGKDSGCEHTIRVVPSYGVPPSQRGAQSLKPLRGVELKGNVVGRTYRFEGPKRSKLWQTFHADGSCEVLVEDKDGRKSLTKDCAWEFQGCTVNMRYGSDSGAETRTRATLYPFERVVKFKVWTNGAGAVVRDGNFLPKRYYAILKDELAKQDR